MTDRHKEPPQAVRLPGDLRAWYRERAAADGRSLNSVLVAALEEYRTRHDSGSTTPAASSRKSATTSPRARKPREDTAPPATFRPARVHALTCKCGVCKLRANGGKS